MLNSAGNSIVIFGSTFVVAFNLALTSASPAHAETCDTRATTMRYGDAVANADRLTIEAGKEAVKPLGTGASKNRRRSTFFAHGFSLKLQKVENNCPGNNYSVTFQIRTEELATAFDPIRNYDRVTFAFGHAINANAACLSWNNFKAGDVEGGNYISLYGIRINDVVTGLSTAIMSTHPSFDLLKNAYGLDTALAFSFKKTTPITEQSADILRKEQCITMPIIKSTARQTPR